MWKSDNSLFGIVYKEKAQVGEDLNRRQCNGFDEQNSSTGLNTDINGLRVDLGVAATRVTTYQHHES